MTGWIESRRSRPLAVAALFGTPTLLVVCWFGMPSGTAERRPAHGERFIDPETSCGPVSLAVVSEYLGQPGTIARFHAATNAGELGVCSMKDLLRAARGHGLTATAVRYDPAIPPSHQLPMILYVDDFHFVAALPGRDGAVVLVDPPARPTSVPWSTLKGRWKGEAVVVGRSEADVRVALARD